MRVVQLTLLGVAAFLARLSLVSASDGIKAEAVWTAILSVGLLAFAAWMGFRVVRGPQPPDLDG